MSHHAALEEVNRVKITNAKKAVQHSSLGKRVPQMWGRGGTILLELAGKPEA